jgi:hypothetical protein
MPESKPRSWEDERAALEAALLSISNANNDPQTIMRALRDLYRSGKRDQALYDAPHMRRPETADEREARINRLYGRKAGS